MLKVVSTSVVTASIFPKYSVSIITCEESLESTLALKFAFASMAVAIALATCSAVSPVVTLTSIPVFPAGAGSTEVPSRSNHT